MPKLKIIEIVEKTTEKEVSVREYIAHQIKYWRRKRGLDQSEFARRIGLSRTSVINIEMGRHSTTCETMYKMCEVLSIRIQDIFPNPTP